jgi:hypothetical protein
MRRLAPGLALLLVLALPRELPAAERDGVVLPDSVVVDGVPLALTGTGLRKKLFFKVYVAGLYLSAPVAEGTPVLADDVPCRLVMHFLRDVGADKINEAWREGVAKNVPDASPELTARVELLCAMTRDVRDGEAIELTYVPGRGTEVRIGEDELGSIPGHDFAQAWLACLVGPNPGPGQDFKQELLGRD